MVEAPHVFYGLQLSLYAHLGRDPFPLALMKARAPSCHRWVERMNVADSGPADFPDVAEHVVSDDEIPGTLVPILRLMAEDYVPELQSIVASVDE